ncbi:MAG: hypothetical protein LBC79_01380 [Deltaproteobacteria bacterium]|jgi:hypothetical protein|nr:hypothetical protein [Deltaproteobacteria bacterium]
MPHTPDRSPAPVLDSLSLLLDKVFPLLEQAIETCPDELWATKQGGFYYWQQLYHLFARIDAYIKDPHEPPAQNMYGADVSRLLRHEEQAPTPQALLSLAKTMRAGVDEFIAVMTWEKLYARNESRSQIMGCEVSNLGSLVTLVGHAFYHLGICDCTLRNHGYKGFL